MSLLFYHWRDLQNSSRLDKIFSVCSYVTNHWVLRSIKYVVMIEHCLLPELFIATLNRIYFEAWQFTSIMFLFMFFSFYTMTEMNALFPCYLLFPLILLAWFALPKFKSGVCWSNHGKLTLKQVRSIQYLKNTHIHTKRK